MENSKKEKEDELDKKTKKELDKIINPIFKKVLQEGRKSGKVKKITANPDFYFSIINAIKLGMTPSDICSKFGISKQNLNYYLKPLKIDGILVKEGYGVWEINEEKYQQFLATKEVKKSSAVVNSQLPKVFTSQKVRGHGFQFTLKIPKLDNWEKREDYLIKNEIEFIKIGSNWEGQRIFVKGHKVWLTPISIVVYAPEWKSWFADISTNAKSHAIYDFLQIIRTTENMLKVSFEINKQYKFKVTRQHYGLVKNALAIQYDKEGKKLYCVAEKGFWLVIDNSHNLHETETLHPKDADTDNIKVQDFFNSLERNPITVDHILSTFHQIAEIQLKAEQEREYYAKNLESHVSAIKTLESSILKFDKRIESLSKKPPKPPKYPIKARKHGLSDEEMQKLKSLKF